LKDDAGLVHAYREGDDSAFEELVRRHQPRLRRQCARIVGIDDAEDAVQQALLSASRSLRAGDEDVDVGRWLHRVAHNASIDALRRRPDATVELDETIDGVPQPPDVAIGRANLRATVAAIQDLPDAQRRALLLSVFEDRSWEEIAAELGTGEGAVRGLLHRARRGMRTAVALCVFPFFLIFRSAKAATTGGGSGASGGGAASAGASASAGGIGTAGKIVAVLAVGGAAAGGATIGVTDSLRSARGTGSSIVASREAPSSTPPVTGGAKHGGRPARHPHKAHRPHRGAGRRAAGAGGGAGSGGGSATGGGSTGGGGGSTTGGGSTPGSAEGQHGADGTGGNAKLPGTGGDSGGDTETTPIVTPTDSTPTDTTPTDTTPTDTTPTDTTPTDTTPEQPPAPATVARVDGFTPRGNGGLLHVIFDSGDDVRAYVGEYTVVTCDTVSNDKLVSQTTCSPSNLATNERVVRATHAVNSGGSDVWNEVEVIVPS
jgi:RNA polymerase sigma-70 factor (ECF subfamily)